MTHQRLPTSLALLHESFLHYKKHYRAFLQISALFILLNFLSSAVMVSINAVSLAILALGIVGEQWVYLLLIHLIKDNKSSMSFSEILEIGRKKILPFLFISFLVGVVILFGFILFILPGVIFAAWFAFAHYIFIVEHEQGIQALIKSRLYVNSKSFEVLWRLFFVFILALLIAIFGFFLQYVGVSFPVMYTIVSILIFLVLPFISIYLFLLYRRLKDHS